MEKEPKILIGCPVTSLKKGATGDYLNAIKGLSYKNRDILLIDNSKGNELFEVLKKEEGIEVIKSDYSDNIREMIARDRNAIRERVLENGYDYFFSLEQDIIPPSNVIEKLLANEKDICCGLYFNFFELKRNDKQKLLGFLPVFFTWLDSAVKDMNLTRRMGFEEAFPSRLMEIPNGGTGCMLIKREVLEKIEFRYVKEYEGFDDVWFCNDARKLGKSIWLDTSIVCNHLFGGWDKEMRERVWKK